jgi:hypothetical protein
MFFVLFTQYSIISRILHYSIVPWPRPGFTGLSSIASSSVKLQRHQALLCKSGQAGHYSRELSNRGKAFEAPFQGAEAKSAALGLDGLLRLHLISGEEGS